MKERILITGGAGYLGSVLTRHMLEHGYAVTVLDNFSFGQTGLLSCCSYPSFDVVRGDSPDLLQSFPVKHVVTAGKIGQPQFTPGQGHILLGGNVDFADAFAVHEVARHFRPVHVEPLLPDYFSDLPVDFAPFPVFSLLSPAGLVGAFLFFLFP